MRGASSEYLTEGSNERLTDDPSEQQVDRTLSALSDSDCRELLRRLTDEPLTAEELSRVCGIPSSTLYRKLDKLVDGGLVDEKTKISTSGRNATLYERCVEGLVIRIADPDGIELETTGSAESDRGDGSE